MTPGPRRLPRCHLGQTRPQGSWGRVVASGAGTAQPAELEGGLFGLPKACVERGGQAGIVEADDRLSGLPGLVTVQAAPSSKIHENTR
jgi:hypothetical protein